MILNALLDLNKSAFFESVGKIQNKYSHRKIQISRGVIWGFLGNLLVTRSFEDQDCVCTGNTAH
jgi:hypothetical protein